MSNITFICEGPSEKKLVDHVLIPYWTGKGLSISASVIVLGEENPRCKGSGGDATFDRLKIDLSSAMEADRQNSFFTTIFDCNARHCFEIDNFIDFDRVNTAIKYCINSIKPEDVHFIGNVKDVQRIMKKYEDTKRHKQKISKKT